VVDDDLARHAGSIIIRNRRHFILYSVGSTHLPHHAQGAAMALPEITDNTFQAEVVEAATPTLVDFWAPWCGPCRMVGPVLEQIDAEREDVRVVKVNTDENPQIASQYQILSIPTMILFKNGQAVHQIVGAQPKPRIEQQLDAALSV
jgi:thioredoxin 1